LLVIILQDKLEKEEKLAKVNQLKLQNQWRVIMRKMRAEEVQGDVRIMKETFQRKVDCKNALIHSLAKDIVEAEEQYRVALRRHLVKLEEMLAFQQKRIRKLEQEYAEELETLRVEFDKERKGMIAQHEAEMKELRDILYTMELRYRERETDAEHEFQGIMDDLKNKHLEDTHALKAQCQATLDALWAEFQRQTQEYRRATEERKMKFEALKKKDEESAHTIARQMSKIQKLQDSIADLRRRMAANTKDSDEKTRAIKEDQQAVLTRFRELKMEMNASREAERKNLTTLTLQSDAAMKALQRTKEKGERILTLAEMCRKLETEEEKVLPFYSCSLDEEAQSEAASVLGQPPSEALAKVMQEYGSLENFWKRYNKVLLDRLAQDKEKEMMEKENQQLKALLKQYLDGISVSDEILNRANPLLLVNHRTNLPKLNVPVGDPRVQRAKVNVVEAAHAVKNIL
jgi:DNA-binding Xre family transcriptional regulator